MNKDTDYVPDQAEVNNPEDEDYKMDPNDEKDDVSQEEETEGSEQVVP